MFESTEGSQVRALKYDNITKSASFTYRYTKPKVLLRCDKAFVVAIDLKAHVKFVHDREENEDDSDSKYRIRIEKRLGAILK